MKSVELMSPDEAIEMRFELFREACKMMDQNNYKKAASIFGKLAFAMVMKIDAED